MRTAEPSWMTLARRFDGVAEIKGPHHHAAILDLLDAADGKPGDGKTVQGIRDDETPWCASFVSGVLELDGVRSARSAWARSYVSWGRNIDGIPQVGAIVVFERGPSSGHVGFIAGRTAAGDLVVLGGNQSDKVCLARFSPQRVLGYRWPVDRPLPIEEARNSWTRLPLHDAGTLALSRNEA